MPHHGHCPACSTSLQFPDRSSGGPLQCPVCTARLLTQGMECAQIPFTDYYKLLGVDSRASQYDVVHMIRKKIFDLHPDRNPGNPDAEKLLRDVLEAKKNIGESEDRAEYDKLYFASMLKKWSEPVPDVEVISAGPEHSAGKRGSQDRTIDGIDHLKGQIEGIEDEADQELVVVRRNYSIIGIVVGCIIGLVVAQLPGLILFGIVGAIVGQYLGSRKTGEM